MDVNDFAPSIHSSELTSQLTQGSNTSGEAEWQTLFNPPSLLTTKLLYPFTVTTAG